MPGVISSTSCHVSLLTKSLTRRHDLLFRSLSSLPNIALSDVPVGKDENSNKEISKSGTLKEFNFNPLPSSLVFSGNYNRTLFSLNIINAYMPVINICIFNIGMHVIIIRHDELQY